LKAVHGYYIINDAVVSQRFDISCLLTSSGRNFGMFIAHNPQVHEAAQIHHRTTTKSLFSTELDIHTIGFNSIILLDKEQKEQH
jgi:hypothetical protein